MEVLVYAQIVLRLLISKNLCYRIVLHVEGSGLTKVFVSGQYHKIALKSVMVLTFTNLRVALCLSNFGRVTSYTKTQRRCKA